MNRIGSRILHLILIVMIGLSFYLTYLIWVSPVSNETLVDDGSGKGLPEDKPLKAQKDVFLPLKLRYQEKENNQETQNEPLLKTIQEFMNASTYSEGKMKTHKNTLDYQRSVAMTSGIELSYALDFPLKEYLQIFRFDLATVDEQEEIFKFSKIQVDFANQRLRFLNDQSLSVFEAKIESDLTDLSVLVEQADVQWVALEKIPTFLNNHYLTKDALKLKKYSYISSTRPYTIFRDAFFSNPNSVRSNSSVLDTYLYEGSESLTIKQHQEIIYFQGSTTTAIPFDIFSTSFNYVANIGASYGSTRILDQLRNKIDYRIFVEGFPIFSPSYEGRISFDFQEMNESNELNVTIQGNLDSLQIPIPSEEVVVLPASQVVIETLYDKGLDPNLVQTLLIGYEWKNLEDTGVVDLIPHWYIKYGEEWFSYEELLQLLTIEEKGE